MPDLYESVWRSAWLRVPSAPVLLVQEWTKDVWQAVLDQRDAWSWLRREADLTLPAVVEGTVAVSEGVASATSAGLVLTTTHENRQLRIAGAELYTVLDVTSGVATLDRAWAGATAVAASVQVYQAYLTMPAGFTRWLTLVDSASGRPVGLGMTEAEVAAADPRRTRVDGTGLQLVSYRPAADGRTRFEVWPHVLSAARVLSGLYLTEGEALEDDDALPEGISRGLLIEGVLARAAQWPGTPTVRNPYFNLALATQHSERFDRLLHDAELSDEERYPTWTLTPEERYRGMSGERFPRMAYDD